MRHILGFMLFSSSNKRFIQPRTYFSAYLSCQDAEHYCEQRKRKVFSQLDQRYLGDKSHSQLAHGTDNDNMKHVNKQRILGQDLKYSSLTSFESTVIYHFCDFKQTYQRQHFYYLMQPVCFQNHIHCQECRSNI